MSRVFCEGYAWPSTCSRRACHRRPRKARIEVRVDDDGNLSMKVLALCRQHNDQYVAAIEAVANTEEAAP